MASIANPLVSRPAERTLNRLYIWEDNPEGWQALELLRSAGVGVVTFPQGGSLPPELRIGRFSYFGLAAIREAITHWEKQE